MISVKTRTVTLRSEYIEGARFVIYCGITRAGKVRIRSAINLVTAEKRGELVRRHIARRSRDYGFNIVYPKPKDGCAYEMHHIDKDRVIPVLALVHKAVRHNGPLFSLEGVLG